MKIAQVCPYDFSRPGGVKSHIVSLSRQLSKIGHEVKIIAPNINKDQISEPNVFLFGKNRSVGFGGTKIDVNIALGTELEKLKSFLDKEQFDIIHFHTIWNPWLPIQIRKLSKSKHVATFHDTPKSQFIGKTIMPLAAKAVFQLLDEVISVSETQAGYIRKFSSRPISIIPNGIELDAYQQGIKPIQVYQDGKFNLLFLGRLEPRKGVKYALESFKQLKTQHPQLRLLIAGDGEERFWAEQFISQNNLKDAELLGFVSEEVKLQLLKTADLYIAPAIYGESFGIVLLEAMAMNTPIAGFANEGYQNVLTPEMTKYFANPKDQQALTEAIGDLIKNQQVRNQLAVEGLNEVKKYDWTEVAKPINEIYNRVIQSK